jgi:hypothetical protein
MRLRQSGRTLCLCKFQTCDCWFSGRKCRELDCRYGRRLRRQIDPPCLLFRILPARFIVTFRAECDGSALWWSRRWLISRRLGRRFWVLVLHKDSDQLRSKSSRIPFATNVHQCHFLFKPALFNRMRPTALVLLCHSFTCGLTDLADVAI